MTNSSISSLCLTTLFVIVFLSCGPSQEDYQNLKTENQKLTTELKNTKSELNNAKSELEHLKRALKECTLTVEDLKNTPTERLAKARSLQAQENEPEAEKEFKELIEKYPDSDEAKVAKTALKEIEKKREEERMAKEKERIEAEKKKEVRI